jgi:hypothetical protein
MTGAESLGFAIATDHARALLDGNVTVASHDGAAGSLDGVLGNGGASETDAARARGEEQFERAVQAMAQASDQVDSQWKQYRAACAGKYTLGTVANGREWFGLWGNTVLLDNESMPECKAMRAQLDRSAAQISAGMKQAEEDARRAGVYPGTTRSIRARYSMEWPGWDR